MSNWVSTLVPIAYLSNLRQTWSKTDKETDPFTRNESESWRSFCPSSSSKKRREETETGAITVLPHFIYHPDPLATGSFVEGEAKLCPSCGKESNIYYDLIPYCIDNIENFLPFCICKQGLAAQKIRCGIYPRCWVARWIGSRKR